MQSLISTPVNSDGQCLQGKTSATPSLKLAQQRQSEVTQLSHEMVESASLSDTKPLRQYTKQQLLQIYIRQRKTDNFFSVKPKNDLLSLNVDAQLKDDPQGQSHCSLSKRPPITTDPSAHPNSTQLTSEHTTHLFSSNVQKCYGVPNRFDIHHGQNETQNFPCVKSTKPKDAGRGFAPRAVFPAVHQRQRRFDEKSELPCRYPFVPEASNNTMCGMTGTKISSSATYFKLSTPFQNTLEEGTLPWRKKERPPIPEKENTTVYPLSKKSICRNQFEVPSNYKAEEVASKNRSLTLYKQAGAETAFPRPSQGPSGVNQVVDQPKNTFYGTQTEAEKGKCNLQHNMEASWISDRESYNPRPLITESFPGHSTIKHDVLNEHLFANEFPIAQDEKTQLGRDVQNASFLTNQLKSSSLAEESYEGSQKKDPGDDLSKSFLRDFSGTNSKELLKKLHFLELRENRDVSNMFESKDLMSSTGNDDLPSNSFTLESPRSIPLCDKGNASKDPWPPILNDSKGFGSFLKSDATSDLRNGDFYDSLHHPSNFSPTTLNDSSLEWLDKSFDQRLIQKFKHEFNSSTHGSIPLSKSVEEEALYSFNKPDLSAQFDTEILLNIRKEKEQQLYGLKISGLSSQNKDQFITTHTSDSWLSYFSPSDLPKSSTSTTGQDKSHLMHFAPLHGENTSHDVTSFSTTHQEEKNGIKANPQYFSPLGSFLLEQEGLSPGSTLGSGIDFRRNEPHHLHLLSNALANGIPKSFMEPLDKTIDESKAYPRGYGSGPQSLFVHDFADWAAPPKDWSPIYDLTSGLSIPTIDTTAKPQCASKVCPIKSSLQNQCDTLKPSAQRFSVSDFPKKKSQNSLPPSSSSPFSSSPTIPAGLSANLTEDAEPTRPQNGSTALQHLLTYAHESENNGESPYNGLMPRSLYDKVWEYRDPSGKVQGPFSSIEMSGWWRANFFPETLLMRYHINCPWVSLNNLYPKYLIDVIPPFSSLPFPVVQPNGEVIHSFVNGSKNQDEKSFPPMLNSEKKQLDGLNKSDGVWKECKDDSLRGNTSFDEASGTQKTLLHLEKTPKNNLKAVLRFSGSKSKPESKMKSTGRAGETSSNHQGNSLLNDTASYKTVTRRTQNVEGTKPPKQNAGGRKTQSDTTQEDPDKKLNDNLTLKPAQNMSATPASGKPLLKDFFSLKSNNNSKSTMMVIVKKMMEGEKDTINEPVSKQKKASWNIPAAKTTSSSLFDEIEFPEPSSLCPKDHGPKQHMGRAKVSSASGNGFAKQSKRTLHEFIKSKTQTATRQAWSRIPVSSPLNSNEPHPLDLPSLEKVAKSKYLTSKHSGAKPIQNSSKSWNGSGNNSTERSAPDSKKKNLCSGSSLTTSHDENDQVTQRETESATPLTGEGETASSSKTSCTCLRRTEDLLSTFKIKLDSGLIEQLIQLKNKDDVVQFLQNHVSCNTFSPASFAEKFLSGATQSYCTVACEKLVTHDQTPSAACQLMSTLSQSNTTCATETENGWTRIGSRNSGQSGKARLNSTG